MNTKGLQDIYGTPQSQIVLAIEVYISLYLKDRF